MIFIRTVSGRLPYGRVILKTSSSRTRGTRIPSLLPPDPAEGRPGGASGALRPAGLLHGGIPGIP
ncbi:hypothetical protein Misp03_06340 [Microbispora sp. NBRC 16548]|nr:hypothetical protein Misp03_06340 [Microbispora sp. NBRC 16548]